MKIHSLHLTSYGKFKEKTISFTDGINYIYGKNEAGKSTLMSFIKAMLYGFSGRGADGDRRRYMPWDGGRLSGEMTVTLSDGRRVILSRTSGKTPAQDEFKALDAVTGAECTVDLAAEIGVGENAFLKTVFIRQMGADLAGGDEELTDRLINLAGSGDAETGYDEAMAYLRDRIRIYKHQRGDGGQINEIKRKLTDLQAEIEDAEAENRKFLHYISEEKTLRAEIEVLQKRAEALQGEMQAARAGEAVAKAADALKRLEAMRSGKTEAETLLHTLNEKKEQLSAFENSINDSVFAPPENPAPLEQQSRTAGKNRVLSWLGAGLMAVLGIIFALYVTLPLGAVCLLAAVIFCIIGIKQGRAKKAIEESLARLVKAEEDREKELAAFGCSSLKEYTEKRAEKLALDERIAAISEKIALLSAELSKAEAEAEALSKAARSFAGVNPSDRDPKEAAAEAERIHLQLEEKIRKKANLEGILTGGREGRKSADLLLTERTALLEQLEEAETKHEALVLAAETMEAVYTELSRDFTPRINEKASEYLSVLTGRENEKLLLDKKYAVTVGRGDHRPLKAFSGGTMDQAFLAVRLAISELVLTDENMPLFLDDSFLQYDEAREENAVSLLRRIAEKRQVFWFSCRKRETEDIKRIEL